MYGPGPLAQFTVIPACSPPNVPPLPLCSSLIKAFRGHGVCVLSHFISGFCSSCQTLSLLCLPDRLELHFCLNIISSPKTSFSPSHGYLLSLITFEHSPSRALSSLKCIYFPHQQLSSLRGECILIFVSSALSMEVDSSYLLLLLLLKRITLSSVNKLT